MMATIICLPDEIITIILEDDNISVKDIMSFSSTCKRFRRIVQSNSLWEAKFYQRCPSARKKYSIEKKKRISGNFQEKIKTGLKCIKILQYYVLLSNDEILWSDKEEEFNYFLRSTVKNSIIYFFVLDECRRIVSAKLSRQPFNLSFRYNFDLIFHCLKQYRFLYKLLKKFPYMPQEEQLPEQFYITIAQYFYPHVSYSVVKTWLDEVAQEVLCRLKIKHSNHSIFSVSPENFSFWRDNNIDDNFWDEREAKQIMYILEEYIFSKEMKREKLFELLILLDLENLHYHDSTYFHTYQLTTIYHSVARRLGILCVPISINKNCIGIAWKPKYNIENWENAEYFYVHLESQELKFVRKRYSSIYSEIRLEPLNILWRNWKRNLLCDFYPLIHHCLLKNHCGVVNSWMCYFCSITIDFEAFHNCFEHELYTDITDFLKFKPNIRSKKQPKRRNKKIKFAIGMIVRHSLRSNLPTERNNERYIHNGVIIGWHFQCERKLIRKSLDSIIPQLTSCEFAGHRHTYLCRCKRFGTPKIIQNQPHYIILADNNKMCYVPQRYVSKCSPKWIKNGGIGQYFSRFKGTHYVPNEKLAKAYPYDMDAIINIHSITNSAISIS